MVVDTPGQLAILVDDPGDWVQIQSFSLFLRIVRLVVLVVHGSSGGFTSLMVCLAFALVFDWVLFVVDRLSKQVVLHHCDLHQL